MIFPQDIERWKVLQRGTLEERWDYVESQTSTTANIQIVVPGNEMGWRAEVASWLGDEAQLWIEIRNNLPEILDVLEAHYRSHARINQSVRVKGESRWQT